MKYENLITESCFRFCEKIINNSSVVTLLTYQAPTDRWSLVSHIVSHRPSVSPYVRQTKTGNTKHLTSLHGLWWVTKLEKTCIFSYSVQLTEKVTWPLTGNTYKMDKDFLKTCFPYLNCDKSISSKSDLKLNYGNLLLESIYQPFFKLDWTCHEAKVAE